MFELLNTVFEIVRIDVPGSSAPFSLFHKPEVVGLSFGYIL
jgi:hypothetical protein